MRREIIGYRKFMAKEKKYCIVTVLYPFSERDMRYGAVGTKAEEVWVPEEFHSLIGPAVIGKNLELEHDVIGQKAYITNVVIGE